MIGLDIPGDSHIRDQNTNGPLSQRWQPVVRVYNLAVISTNLMNQITAIHRSLSPSLMAYSVCSALKLREMKGEGQAERSCFWEDSKTEKGTDRQWKYSSFHFRKDGEREGDSLAPVSFITGSDANLSVQRLFIHIKMWDLPQRPLATYEN